MLTAFLVVLTGCGDTEPVAWQVDQDSALTPERAPLVPIQPPASDEPNATPTKRTRPLAQRPSRLHRWNQRVTAAMMISPTRSPIGRSLVPRNTAWTTVRSSICADYASANFSRCLVVIRSGSIVGEWYWGRNNGRRMDQDNPIKSWSVGKSYATDRLGLRAGPWLDRKPRRLHRPVHPCL